MIEYMDQQAQLNQQMVMMFQQEMAKLQTMKISQNFGNRLQEGPQEVWDRVRQSVIEEQQAIIIQKCKTSNVRSDALDSTQVDHLENPFESMDLLSQYNFNNKVKVHKEKFPMTSNRHMRRFMSP